MEDLRFPLGKFEWIPPEDEQAMARRRAHYIDVLAKLPGNFAASIHGLTEPQLDTPYRPEGWTVRQLVHHVPDSHMQAYGRWKMALTEDEPVIKPYREAEWAKLADSQTVPVDISLQLLAAVHTRWVAILSSMQPTDFQRTLRHPEIGIMSLDRVLALYAWHSAHHTAHITRLRERMGWNPKTAAS